MLSQRLSFEMKKKEEERKRRPASSFGYLGLSKLTMGQRACVVHVHAGSAWGVPTSLTVLLRISCTITVNSSIRRARQQGLPSELTTNAVIYSRCGDVSGLVTLVSAVKFTTYTWAGWGTCGTHNPANTRHSMTQTKQTPQMRVCSDQHDIVFQRKAHHELSFLISQGPSWGLFVTKENSNTPNTAMIQRLTAAQLEMWQHQHK